MAENSRKIVLIHKRAPGDTLVLTGLVRDIARAHPGRFEIDVDTSAPDLWLHNPHVTPFRRRPGIAKQKVEYVKIQYGRGIRDQNHETVHFLSYFHRDFHRQCHVTVPVGLPYPDLHLSEEEKVPVFEGQPYWIIISGGKSDFTAKVWSSINFQQVADALRSRGLGVVQMGSNDKGHWHPPLSGAVNMVGQTNLRDMMRIMYHADGVICGVTCAMHMAAALQRPCVCIAGGREAWWWEAYVNENKGFGPASGKLKVPHRFLHTIGMLECCKHHGCWRNKVVKISEDKSLCYKPIARPGQTLPVCMDMITVEHVMEAVMSYYTDTSLPAISPTPPKPAEVQIVRGPSAEPAPPTPPTKPARPRLLDIFADLPASTNGAVNGNGNGATKPVAPKKSNQRVRKANASVTVPTDMLRLAPGANLRGRGQGNNPKVAMVPGKGGQQLAVDQRVFDHEDVGGKFTVFALLYGPEEFHDLHRRCITSIIATAPKDRIDFRVGSNALNPRSVAMVDELVAAGRITKHYRNETNRYKYPLMREMFRDPDCPIKTKWVVWFDDDSIADRTPDWLAILAQAIIQHHKADNAHMFGSKFVWTLQSGQKEWFESRPWHRGKPWRLHNGKPSPNGNRIIFATGGWWALTHESIVKCDIPCGDLEHNGGDYTIGEQLYQGGYEVKAFNSRKQFVHTSSVNRRGVTTRMPGMQKVLQVR